VTQPWVRGLKVSNVTIRAGFFERRHARNVLRSIEHRPDLYWHESWHLFYSFFNIVGPTQELTNICDQIDLGSTGLGM
jgi:hypothetical protein